MKRTMPANQANHALYQFVAFEVAEVAQVLLATQMGVVVGVAAGTGEWALPRDLNGHQRSAAGDDASPSP
jgi:hypothetical protein